MSEELIIRHCSPTLAGMKTASLFTCAYNSEHELLTNIRRLNRRLSNKGLRIVPLRRNGRRALIYVYRPSKLRADMSDAAVSELLQRFGYAPMKPECCIAKLADRIRDCEEFPHEIGLFLGYPPEDVRGFIENGAEGAKLTGDWKVYGDVANASKLFAKYKKCTKVYIDQWSKGRPVERLAVAG